MTERLKIAGRPNLPTKFADEYTPEERKWIKEQHPDDYRVLVNLEKEHDKKYPPAPAVPATETVAVVETTDATNSKPNKANTNKGKEG
jgi:hypothetical protein